MDYQDAMESGEPFLFHSLLSPYLNAGLLSPLEICPKIEEAYRAGKAPLNVGEGYIRQIIGWREYVRGIYWRKMPDDKVKKALINQGDSFIVNLKTTQAKELPLRRKVVLCFPFIMRRRQTACVTKILHLWWITPN